MTFDLIDARRVLERTPRVLRALLTDLPDAWTDARSSDDAWSPHEVLGHLVHGERADWMPRVRHLLEHGESRAFEPFDRVAMLTAEPRPSIAEWLDEFEREREHSLTALGHLDLTPADFGRPGRHPAFGRVTLGELLATWVAHDLGHVAQITREMARRYREAVGPWRAFLPVMGPVD